jgi:hypothetical protein
MPGMAQVPEMSCTVVPPPTSIEEMIEKAPQHIYVQAWSRAKLGYLRWPQMAGLPCNALQSVASEKKDHIFE